MIPLKSRCGFEGHRFKALVKDLVPFEGVAHDDRQADLDAGQGEAFPFRVPNVLVIHQIVDDPFARGAVSAHQIAGMLRIGLHALGVDRQVFSVNVDAEHPRAFARGASTAKRAVAAVGLLGLVTPLLAGAADEHVGLAIQALAVGTDRVGLV